MRVAVILSGEPRFCAEFDIFLNNLRDTEIEFDWYVYIWNHNPGPDLSEFKLISERWRRFTGEWATEKISQHLPNNHRIISLIATEHQNLLFPDVSKKSHETKLNNVWKMYYSLRQASLLLEEKNLHYDLIIKCRADVSVTDLNLKDIFSKIQQNPQQVIVSKTNHHAHPGLIKINDWVAVGAMNTMKIYCSVYDKIEEYCQDNFIFHPESLLSYHLTKNNLQIVYGDYEVGLRHLGQTINSVYHSQFGQWS